MISGKYQGEIVRQLLLAAIQSSGMLGGVVRCVAMCCIASNFNVNDACSCHQSWLSWSLSEQKTSPSLRGMLSIYVQQRVLCLSCSCSDRAPEFADTRAIFARVGYAHVSAEDCITVLEVLRPARSLTVVTTYSISAVPHCVDARSQVHGSGMCCCCAAPWTASI